PLDFTDDIDGDTRSGTWDVGADEEGSVAQTCVDAGGSCCILGQFCIGGTFTDSSDCGSLCCIGGTCESDTEPPTIPANLSATAISTTQIDLLWDESTDNIGVEGYKIYRDTIEIDDIVSSGSPTESYSDTGLNPDTTYTYNVSAYDAESNESNQSTSDFATTLTEGADTTPPYRDDGFPIGILSSGTTQTTLSLTTDENSTCKYDTSSGVSYDSMSNTFFTTGTMNHSETITGLTDGGSYTYYVRCQDESNNQNPDDYSISFSVALQGNVINAATCEQVDVQAAVNLAVSGDTVMVPAGECTWNIGITVLNNISIVGAGVGSTMITSGGSTLIDYNNTSPSASETFEISDMTLDMNNYGSTAITFIHNSNSVMQRLKIHDLVIDNCGSLAFYFIRLYKGIIYNNIITTNGQLQQNVGGGDGGLAAWNAIQKCSGSPLSCSHDNGDNLYFEDNTMDIGNTNIQSGGAGFSWTFRYNDITYHSVSPAIEWHGNYPSPNNRCSSMDMAVYGNNWSPGSGAGDPYMQPRGGIGLIFYNYADDSGSNALMVNFREENDLGDAAGACSADTNPQPQNIYDTYVWVNEKSTGLTYAFSETDTFNQLTENTDYFIMQSGVFDGTGDATAGGGVGCGTLAEMSTINPGLGQHIGVGFWATDQSCTDLTNLVGSNPTTPISGTLYKWSGVDWQPYYTPYTYPHPLRNEAPPVSDCATLGGTCCISGDTCEGGTYT
ncbi:fibronectin type III domain-containing protein, partial [Patescibacteria group bacterium]